MTSDPGYSFTWRGLAFERVADGAYTSGYWMVIGTPGYWIASCGLILPGIPMDERARVPRSFSDGHIEALDALRSYLREIYTDGVNRLSKDRERLRERALNYHAMREALGDSIEASAPLPRYMQIEQCAKELRHFLQVPDLPRNLIALKGRSLLAGALVEGTHDLLIRAFVSLRDDAPSDWLPFYERFRVKVALAVLNALVDVDGR